MPTNTRDPSLLQRGAVYSLSTMLFGKDITLAGSNTIACISLLPSPLQVSSALVFCFMSFALSPRSTARFVLLLPHVSCS